MSSASDIRMGRARPLHASGITPTPRAHAIVRLERPLVARLQEDLLRGQAFDPTTSTSSFALALSDVSEMAFLPRVLKR